MEKHLGFLGRVTGMILKVILLRQDAFKFFIVFIEL